VTRTAICQLGRFGDIAHILPCIRHIALQEGGKCAVIVSEEFASILEGCSYVESIIVPFHFTDLIPAIEFARARYERVLIGKISEKCVGVTAKCESFSQESWRQIGMLDEWSNLPLVFDLRSPEREAELLKRHTHGRPFALYNVGGKSSPVPDGESWIARNKDRIAPGVDWIDLGKIRAHRIYDLLGLMDKAQVMVTGDTSTLHLAAGSQVPCINLIQHAPTRWHGSLPRNNSIAAWRYDELPHLVDKSMLGPGKRVPMVG
jgi:hypothetical protein